METNILTTSLLDCPLAPGLVIGDRGDTVSQRAERWLDGAGGSQPFFLWLHYLDPHAPYSRPGAGRNKSLRGDMSFRPVHDGSNTPAPVMLTSPDVARLRSGEIRLSEKEKDTVRALYADEVASVDADIGEVLAALDRRSLRGNTLVVCVADHGEEFWEHGGVEHGHTVYEELVDTPLLLRWPGHLPAATQVAGLARIIDVAPTVLDLLGQPLPPGLDGMSLVPRIRGEGPGPEVALTENMLFAEERVGVRTRDRKYVRWASGKEEVYDLRRDAREQRDLAGVEAAVAPLRRLYAQLDLDRASARVATVPVLDDKTRSAMRALGYLR